MLIEPSSEAATQAQPVAPTVLDTIVDGKRRRLEQSMKHRPLARLRSAVRDDRREPRDFIQALSGARRPPVIAELKRASPSQGVMRADFDVAALARAYEAAGAAALSVLTEEDHFQGRLEYLAQARAATRLPVLRKDFIVSPYQVWEAAAAGADAVLLIAAILDDATLAQLVRTAARAGVAALCEAHDALEVERSVRAGAECIGVNNRDLRTLRVDLATGEALGPKLPAGVLAVAESGLRTPADLERMARAGYQAFLIGEPFMQANDPGAALADLLAGCDVPLVKICGLVSRADALQACAAGANAVGFVFAASPRRVTAEQVRAFAHELPAEVMRVGVFAGLQPAEIRIIANACGLHAAQLHGDYTPEEGRQLAAHLPVWRAVAMPHAAKAALAWAPFAEGFVLDSAGPDGMGGRGIAFDWNSARAFVESLRAEGRQTTVLVAGGLTPQNVAAALRASGAAGADVSTGVEAAPGRKNPERVFAFCRAARLAFRARIPAADGPQ
jgi:indole-3-glycerol phosphate synthase/phosphoribosylanthranilate isomerase